MSCSESIAAAFFFLSENMGWFIAWSVVATAGCIALGVVCVLLWNICATQKKLLGNWKLRDTSAKQLPPDQPDWRNFSRKLEKRQ